MSDYHNDIRREAEQAVYLLSENGIDCRLDESAGYIDLVITLSDGVSIRIGCDIYEQLVFTVED